MPTIHVLLMRTKALDNGGSAQFRAFITLHAERATGNENGRRFHLVESAAGGHSGNAVV